MTTYVIRDGKLVEKRRTQAAISFPTPRLSRMQPFESPVTGAEITSWRERERDMAAAGAVDVHDLPTTLSRGRQAQLKEAQDGREQPQSDFQWRDPG